MKVRKEHLDTVKEILAVVGKNSVTPAQFKAVFNSVVKTMRTLRADLDKKADSQELTSSLARLDKEVEALETLMRDAESASKREVKEQLVALKDEMLLEVDSLESRFPDLAPFHESFAEIVNRIPEPETPESIVEKLESIEEEEDKLSIDAIKNLWEELKKLQNRGGGTGGGTVAARELVKTYDLSPHLDGVTKVFAIPGNWTVISVSGTSFPYTYRRLVDYTFTPQQITFTSEIEASTSLATGQTLEVIYVSA